MNVGADPTNVKGLDAMNHSENTLPDQFLSKAAVIETIGLSGSTIDRMEVRGEFPPRIHISSRRVVWRHSDIQQWMDGQPARGLGHAHA